VLVPLGLVHNGSAIGSGSYLQTRSSQRQHGRLGRTVSYVDYPPGRVGQVHHHAGFILAYVLEGSFITKISGQEQRTYRKGELFFEPPGSTHAVSNNTSPTEPARLLAMIFAKKGVPLTMSGRA